MRVLRHWTKQVVCLQLHHMRGSSPPALQQMPCFPSTRATVLLVYRHVALSSVCILYRNPSTAPRPLQHASIMQRIPGYMNCNCAAAVAREAGVCQCASSVAVILPGAARRSETALHMSPVIRLCTCLVGVSSASCFTSANATHRA